MCDQDTRRSKYPTISLNHCIGESIDRNISAAKQKPKTDRVEVRGSMAALPSSWGSVPSPIISTSPSVGSFVALVPITSLSLALLGSA